MTMTAQRLALVSSLALLATLAMRAQNAPPRPPPAQPIPYSHKQHLALGLQCRVCHVNPDAGKLMTYPPTALCMGCHLEVAREKPSIQKLAALAESGKPVPWVRVYEVPDWVYWKHGTHLEAEVPCADCHGPVAERDVIAVETSVVRMIGCVTCHDKRQVFSDCTTACHGPRQAVSLARAMKRAGR
jgi:hypothetical protein